MAGKFSKNALPRRPGAYFNFVAREPEPILANTQGIVVVPFTHSWGPSESVVELNSFGDFLRVFGQGGTNPPAYTPGYQAAYDAFRGEGVPNFGGAGQVLGYRMVGSSGAKSTHGLSNGTTTAITLTAVYDGSYGDKLGVEVVANAIDPTNKADLVIFVEGVEAERFTYAKTNITDLAAQVNGTGAYSGKGSDWVKASSITSGTALTVVSSPAAFTGGDDGSTLVAGDWTALYTAVEPYRFSIFAAQNLTDTSLHAALKTWAQNLNAKGKRFLTVVGGGTSVTADTMSVAVARSATFDDPDFVNLGGGVYTDDKFGDLNPSALVARLGGIIAQRGERLAISFARLAGLAIKTGVTEAEILQALAGGVVTISRDSNQVAPVRLELGVTTFTDTNDVNRDLDIYSNPKFVRTMHGIETELTEFFESNVVGKMPVNAGTRDYVRGQAEARFSLREIAQVVQPGWAIQTSQSPPPSDDDDFVALDYSVKFSRDVEKVLNTVTVG